MPLYELGAALVSAGTVSPIMTVIDTAIIKSQFQKINLTQACTETIKDYSNGTIKFKRPFSIMSFVYGSTYATANLTELTCHKLNIDYKMPTLVATSLVNVATIAYKDREYAKIFNQSKMKFPLTAYGLFALRDSFTIGSSFILKKDVISYLEKYMSHNVADLTASFAVPMAAQVISTPIHIYSIDLFQRPQDTFSQRLEHIRKLYLSVCSGRIIRVIPAFAIGGFINDMIRPKRD